MWAGHRQAFIEYFNDREALCNSTGLGNGNTGILLTHIQTLIRECAWIWVWCWQDPFDLELNLGGGGGGSTGPYVEPWEDDYNRLRFCEGVYDLHDTGPDNPDMIHPDYDYCIIWMEYLNDCIIPNLPSTYNQPGYPTYADYIEQWAQIQEFEPELFARVISGTEGCIPTGEIDDYITEHYEDAECRSAINAFEDTYDVDLTKTVRRAIWQAFEEDSESPACINQDNFDEWVIQYLTETMEECGTYDFIWCEYLDEDSEDGFTGICPDSFLFVTTGDTYTCDVARVSFAYRGADNRNIYVGDLCVTVPKRDYEGHDISSSQASELMAAAWNEAMTLTAAEFAAGNHTMTSLAYKNLFLENLRLGMLFYFDGTFGVGTMNLINSDCSGNYPTSTPRYSIFC